MSSTAGVDKKLSFICYAHVILVGVIRDTDYAAISALGVERGTRQIG